MTSSDHPCFNCPAVAVDHAIVCPFLGVIAAGRHKRIRRMEGGDALQRLSGPRAGVVNRRSSIELRSAYWQNPSLEGLVPGLEARYADREGTLYLATRNGRGRGQPSLEGAQRQARLQGLPFVERQGGVPTRQRTSTAVRGKTTLALGIG